MTTTQTLTPNAGFKAEAAGAGRFDGWTFGASLVALAIAVPLLTVIGLALFPAENIWGHLASTVLPRLMWTTLLLMAGVAIGTTLIGVGSAWLVGTYQFPGRRIFEWALLLPLAVPSYVIAFVYTDLLEYAGPVQGVLRDVFGWTTPHDYWFPDIRSLGGAIAMMSLVLYPYVYLLTRAAFLEQSAGVLEVARTLGRSPWQEFIQVAVPLARPSIVVGVSLAMMETLNDFGTVDFFGVQTLALGIFDVWLNMNNVGGAAQIAILMLAVVIGLIFAERYARRKQRFHHSARRYKRPGRKKLSPFWGMLAILACLAPLGLGFILPLSILGADSYVHFDEVLESGFAGSALNSLMLSGLAALFAVSVGVFLAYGIRLRGHRFLVVVTRFASVGYAVPGAVLAIGVLIPMAWFDNQLDGFLRDAFDISSGLLLSGTIAALTFAYVVRFLALSLGAVETSLGRITANIDGAARALGATPGQALIKVHLPIIRASLLTAAILVFVDGMKELPMTTVMRPFNFETLATQVHQFASAEQFEQAAPAALAIVAVGIIPVIFLSLAMNRAVYGRDDAAEGMI